MSAHTLNISSVAVLAQATLTGFLAFTLRVGAKTPARRVLATSLAGLCTYAIALGFSTATEAPTRGRWNVLVLGSALFAALGFCAYARWLVEGADPERTPRLPGALAAPVGAAAALLCAHDLIRPPDAGKSSPYMLGALGLIVVVSVVMFHSLVRAHRAGSRAAGSLARACLWPIAPIVFNVALIVAALGGAPLPNGPYTLVRDLCMLFFAFALLSSYLDHGHEPMSLRNRLVAGTLTAVLALVTAVAHALGPWIDPGATAAAGSGASIVVRLSVLAIAAAATVVVVLPRLFRRSVLEPLAALVDGLRDLEAGKEAALVIEHQDELGHVMGAFNRMAAALTAARRRLEEEVRAVSELNAELRHQVTARSRQLAEALSAMGQPSAALGPGDVVAGRYRVTEVLGQGGMGTVYAVTRDSDERALALKVLSGSSTSDQAARLAREAEIAASLDHEHLVRVIDVGLHEGRVFLVMHRVFGGTLEDARPRFGDQPWALRRLEEIAAGVAELHERGIVHRDLKPANVLLDENARGVARITDFGIARRDAIDALAVTARASATLPGPGRSGSGPLMGTIAYMAPELASGGTAGPAVDVYSFGAIAFELLTGRFPFEVPPMVAALCGMELAPARPLPETVDEETRALVARCLALEPAERPRAKELVGHLARG